MNKVLMAVVVALIAAPSIITVSRVKSPPSTGMSYCGACGESHGSNDRDNRDRDNR